MAPSPSNQLPVRQSNRTIVPTRRSRGLAFDEDAGPAPPIPPQPSEELQEDDDDDDIGDGSGSDDGASELSKEAEKRRRFDVRFKTTERSNEQVLGTCHPS
jgi:hypothetical protein